MPDISLQQLLSTNFSLSPSGYTGSQGAVGYTGSAGTGGGGGGSGFGYTTLSTRTYTGDGTTTAYTISSDLSANSVVVSENGILQTPDTDYTVAGTTLTFTTAPATGVAVQIREIANTPGIGYTGSSGDIFIPKITNVQVTDNTYTVLDDTAVALTGGYIKLTGTGFASGCQVLVGTVAATSTTFVSSTEVRAQLPATAAGTYIVYLVNADGGVAIRINGVTFSATPTWITGSTLDTAASDTAISYQLSATDATTYTLQAGSSLPPGLTLSNVGLISGTVTGISSETTYSFTVVAVDAENQDSPRTFSVTITSGDQYWNYTTTLLSPTLSALPFNRDASTNNFAVTIAGDTKPYNFNPYTPGYYSNYFDGTGDYLRLSNTVLNNSAFTISFWFYPTTSSVIGLFDSGPGQTSCFRNYPANTIQDQNGGSVSFTANTNQWNWMSIVGDGTNFTVYLNGSSAGSAAYASLTDVSFTIGTINSGGDGAYTGYISNFRIKNVASVDPVPTAPLTAVANTTLLTCSSNRFIDNSTNAFAITRNGDTKVTSFIPYTPSSSYSTYGSTYLDGTGDYLTPPSSSAFAFGTSDFTLECWIYTSSPSDSPIYEGRADGSLGLGFTLTAFSSTVIRIWVQSALISATISNYTNTWTHIAVVRNSGTTTLYINGVSGGTTTSLGNLTDTQLLIGAGRYSGGGTISAYFNGYISNFRIVKGTAVYTTNFTPPTAPLTAIANTSLLTCQSNQPVANNTFLDNSTNNFAITRNGNTTQGTFSPYGESWSNYFDGSGDYLTSPSNSWTSLAGQFTLEFWVNFTTIPTANPFIGVNSAGGFNIYNDGTRLTPNIFGTGNIFNSTLLLSSLTAGTWYHIAVTRNSSNLMTIWLNGESKGSTTTSSSYTAGAWQIGNSNFNCYISNFRATSTCLYTTSFTPSTAPLQSIAGTSLLTCQSPNLVDNSPNNFAITKNGDVSVQKFGPFAGTTLPTPYYSAYFDGTGDYLSIANNAAFNLTADFTVELWFNFSSLGANPYTFIGNYVGSSSGWSLQFRGDASNIFRWGFGDTAVLNSSAQTLTVNTWYHLAAVRSGSTFTLYLNGTQIGTTTSSTLFTSSAALWIGGLTGIGQYFAGYISNARVVTGTAVYTGAFTPPTSPLTAISGTSLLTCQSNTFVDNSTNNFTITANGNSKPTTFSPFTVTYSTKQSYTPAVFGGSMYFDGTGDYLYPAINSLQDLTGDFTNEHWCYPIGGDSWTVCCGTQSGSGTWYFKANTTTGVVIYAMAITTWAGVTLTSASNVLRKSAWNHLCATRSGNTFNLYVNGVVVATTTNSGSLINTGRQLQVGIFIESTGTTYFNGYLSDIRLVKGQALYTSSFVPGNQPLAPVKNTTLLLSGTSAGIYDSSENAVFETVGDAKLNTSVVKFSGGTSMYFDGTGDYLYTPSNNLSYVMGVGDFTIELWYYPVTTNNTNPNLMGNYNTTWQSGRWAWHAPHSSYASKYSFWVNNYAANSAMLVSTTNISLNSWVHLAVTRSGSTWKLFVNGTAEATVTSSISLDNSTGGDGYYIGANFYTGDGGRYINSYISDLRITRGIARYTTNFTAPTAPFTNK